MKRTLVLLTAIIICIVSTIAFLHSSKKTEYNILLCVVINVLKSVKSAGAAFLME